MASPVDREKAVYAAKLAEAAERYNEMLESMENVAKMGAELTAEERNLLSIGYKHAIGSKRASRRTLLKIEQTEKNEAKIKRINEYREKVEIEINDMCKEILSIIDEHLIPSCKPSDDICNVFYYKMKGDSYRYLAEINDRQNAAGMSLQAYEAANIIAVAGLPSTNLIRLSLALNYSVFNYDILDLPKRACKFAKQAIDEAITELDSLDDDEFKDTNKILQILKENITLWNQNVSEEDDNNSD